MLIFLEARITYHAICVFPLDKFWYCRLSPNHKVLHYGDLEESPQGEVPHDSLQDKCKWLCFVGGMNFSWLGSFLVTQEPAENYQPK